MIPTFVIALAVTAISTPLLIQGLARVGMVDSPTDRSLHATPMLRGGGAALVLGATLALALSGQVGERLGMALLLVPVGYAVVGLLDPDDVGAVAVAVVPNPGPESSPQHTPVVGHRRSGLLPHGPAPDRSVGADPAATHCPPAGVVGREVVVRDQVVPQWDRDGDPRPPVAQCAARPLEDGDVTPQPAERDRRAPCYRCGDPLPPRSTS